MLTQTDIQQNSSQDYAGARLTSDLAAACSVASSANTHTSLTTQHTHETRHFGAWSPVHVCLRFVASAGEENESPVISADATALGERERFLTTNTLSRSALAIGVLQRSRVGGVRPRKGMSERSLVASVSLSGRRRSSSRRCSRQSSRDCRRRPEAACAAGKKSASTACTLLMHPGHSLTE